MTKNELINVLEQFYTKGKTITVWCFRN